ncbi:MAG: biotin/lipoyl-containing protein [Candidatus Lernaella stagnicola]|nr:biotin/lipoyl-containing protein [Candidatus Lernaella stagnicola]
MREEVFVVSVPQLGVNDDTATIVEWFVAEGDEVAVGAALCAVETAKASYEVEAEVAGRVVPLAAAGTEIRVRDPIALIGADMDALDTERRRLLAAQETETQAAAAVEAEAKATDQARRLAAELGINLTEIATDGIIREKHVRAFVEKQAPDDRPTPAEIKWNPDRKPVMIYGAGRGAVTLKECLDTDRDVQVVCFVDDDPQHPLWLKGLPVYHRDRLAEIVTRGVSYLATEIAAGVVRLRIRELCDERGLHLINAVHPRAFVSPSATLGRGNFIKAGAVVATGTVVGDCCVIDNGAIVAHDNILDDACHLTPGVSLGSGIRVGSLAIVGIGAAVATGVTIGRRAIVSPGAAVVKDVPDDAVVEGVPAKIVGRRKGE